LTACSSLGSILADLSPGPANPIWADNFRLLVSSMLVILAVTLSVAATYNRQIES